MKKFFLILGLVLGVAIVALAIFIVTFDADRYRPLLVRELQKAIGKPVQLDRLSLGWRSGIAIQLQGLTIAQDTDTTREPMVHVPSASALVRLLPLLRKEIQIVSITLSHPRVRVERDAQGRVNLLGLGAVASPSTQPSASLRASAERSRSTSPVVASQPIPATAAGSVALSVSSLRIDDGSLHWTDALTTPPTDLLVNALNVTIRNIAPGKPMDVEIKGALAAQTPNLSFSGQVTVPTSTQHGSVEHLKVAIEKLPLERLLPTTPAGQPQLSGTLTLTVQGSAPSLEPAQLTRTLSAHGQLKLTDPIVANLNILRAVFERFSMIPGLVETLQARLPQEYQAKFAAKDTRFSPIDLSIQVEQGTLRFQDLRIATDTLQIVGTGSVGLDRVVQIRSTIHIDPALSSAIVRSVKELQALTNAQGELEIPALIQGQAPQVAIFPDLQYLTSRVIATKAIDLLGQFLQKKEGASETTSPDASTSSEGDLVGQLLERALKKHAPRIPQSQ